MDCVTEHNNFQLALEVLQQVIEMTDSSLKPLVDICKPLLELALGEQQSKEQKFMADEFLKLQDELEQISKMASKVKKQIEISGVYLKYSPIEENLRDAIRNVKEIQSYKPVKQSMIEEFLDEYPDALDIEDNLKNLYKGVMEKSILDIKKTSPRDIDEGCACIYRLLCKGIYALMNHKVYTKQTEEDLKATMDEWSKKAADILRKMREEINAYLNDFPNQAKADVENVCLEKGSAVSGDILKMLIEKYGWVNWSVRAFNPSTNFVLISSGEFHVIKGEGHFTHKYRNTIIVVSYNINPQSLVKSQIHQLIKRQIKKASIEEAAESVRRSLPHCVVHIIKGNKTCAAHSFPVEYHYEGIHKKRFKCWSVFVHSEYALQEDCRPLQ